MGGRETSVANFRFMISEIGCVVMFFTEKRCSRGEKGVWGKTVSPVPMETEASVEHGNGSVWSHTEV